MTDINAAPDFLVRPIFQDPDARLLDLTRWHEAVIRLVSANVHAQEIAYKAGDRAALAAAESDQRALWDDWRMVVYEAEALTPRTLQGFALKIRIFAEKHEEWWHEPGLADDEACARAILQQVLSAAGVSPPGRSTFKLADAAADEPAEAVQVLPPPSAPSDPVERLGRRYGALAAAYMETEEDQTLSEMRAIEASATYARPSSLPGAMFLMMATWDRVAAIARELPADHAQDLEPIRRMMASTIDCLEGPVRGAGEGAGAGVYGP